MDRRTVIGAALIAPVGATLARMAEAEASPTIEQGIALASGYLNGTGDAHDLDLAETIIARHLRDDPSVDAWYGTGFVHRARGRHEAALAAFYEAARFDPDGYKAQGQIGMSLVNIGNLESGGKALTQSLLTADPQRAGLYAFNLGRIEFFQRRYAGASWWLWRAIKKRPELDFIRAYLAASIELDGGDRYIARSVLPAGLTNARLVTDQSRNPTGCVMMGDARGRLYDSLLRLGVPADV